MSKEAILIHGWDPHYYNKNCSQAFPEGVAWSHRPQLISLLEKEFAVRYFNLPGFCGEQEPQKKFFEVKDFSAHLHKWLEKDQARPKVIIGYSFGGVIALDHKVRYQDKTPIVLISPALARGETTRSKAARQLKIFVPENLQKRLKGLYQIFFSRYYRQGSPFLRATYDRIVRKNLSQLLSQVEPGGILLIYGLKDATTPWSFVEKEAVGRKLRYFLINEGDHNIGQTHPEKIVEEVKKFVEPMR